MNTMPLISVIVPIYNTDKYLRKCIDSIIQQTYAQLEIILVDDGSADNSPFICDEYAKKDNRITVIHKKNRGLSSARNAGIDQAHGEYLSFIDSDDYVDPEMIEKLYKAITSANADMAICNCEFVYDDNFLGDHHDELLLTQEIITSSQAIKHVFYDSNILYIVAWNKLYKKTLFEHLRYTEGYVHEDEIIIHRLFGECEKIICISDKLYYYVQHQGSIMNQGYTINRLDYLKAMEDRIHFFHENNKKEYENRVAYRMWWYIHEYYFLFEDNEDNHKKLLQALKEFRSVLPSVLKVKEISIKEKITIIIFSINPSLYKKLFYSRDHST